jgi:hypothetical protein
MSESGDPPVLPTWPQNIDTGPSPIDVDTLAHLGPLRGLAGTWEGQRGLDAKPKAEGPNKQAYVERIELQPIDSQTHRPQLLYGQRYRTHFTKPGQVKTYQNQFGYGLWEPATGCVIHTLTIPRGEIAMAASATTADATSFELVATQGLDTWGICSAPFLDWAFETAEFRIKVTVHPDGTWGYEEDMVLETRGQDEFFHHTDRHRLARVAEPTPNPLAR